MFILSVSFFCRCNQKAFHRHSTFIIFLKREGFKRKPRSSAVLTCLDHIDVQKASPEMANSATVQLYSIHLKVKQLEQGHKCNGHGSPPLGTKSVNLALRGLIVNL